MKYGRLVFFFFLFLMIKKYQTKDLTYQDYSHKNILDVLNRNMSEAIIFNTDEMSADIVQIYSYITVRYASGWQDRFQVVEPCKENVKRNKVSVISSLGASVIGLSEGDSLTFGLPGSRITFEIEKVQRGREKVVLSITDRDIKKMLPRQSKTLLSLII